MKIKQFQFWFVSLFSLFIGISICGASALERTTATDIQIELPILIENEPETQLVSSIPAVESSCYSEFVNPLSASNSTTLFLNSNNICNLQHLLTEQCYNLLNVQSKTFLALSNSLKQFNFFRHYKAPYYLA